jgi:uncharacterized protein (TIGR03083 family)
MSATDRRWLADPTLADVLGALRRSHEHLAATLDSLGLDGASAPTYDDEWSVAQVASHLGSGAEIFGLIVEAGLAGEPAPGPDRFGEIWDTWNAKSPGGQVEDAVEADGGFLDRVGSLTSDQAAAWRLELFGAEQTLARLLRMRLSEHAQHTWDIIVPRVPEATLPDEAAGILLGNLPGMVPRLAKGAADVGWLSVQVVTLAPEVGFHLDVSDGSTSFEPVEPAGPGGEPRLELPAEALVRLVGGRLDPEHTPPTVSARSVDLAVLRRLFPGF